ncbi:type I-E CRISPR-associated protein Cse2/CasB [Kitasatospora kifunensis]|uniref:CRISPR system Cascade subunit CasB n=1 Tax=Kitasatospora kifunensis TaxID=58351 RepID=A0A7W7QY29_KITKI|nr:type I-E CRISPR-associated protein Cse2/CasB [Kitasatospora kifunensis]MBB4921907.1 CRISPR system Cascade subunit CasB [Kitasatospora kifunensis]
MPLAPPPPGERTALTSVGITAGTEIARLQRGYLGRRSDAVAALARLRRGAGRDAAAVPELWGLLALDPLYEQPDLDQTRAENSLYTAMTLWAVHQQSQSSPMHQRGQEVGAAVRRLMRPGEIDDAILKRFVRAGTASTLTLLSVRLRELVTLLRRDGVGLDYAVLADQLYWWQFPGRADGVRRAWGRSFHASRRDAEPDPPVDGPAAS